MIKIGVIGAGGNGSGHARYYSESERAEVIAVADPDKSRAYALAREIDAEAFGNYRDFLDMVDAVVISSPNFLHRDHAVECAEAGKHVFCEKPMGLSAEQAEEIAAAVRDAGVQSFVGFSVRFGAQVQTMQAYKDEGRLGRVFSVWSRRLTYMDPAKREGWRVDHMLSGGLLYEINIHELEWMMALGGKVKSVFGRRMAREQQTPRANDHIWFMLNFGDDAVGMHEGSWCTACGEYRRGVIGTAGALTTERWGQKLFHARNGEKETQAEMCPRFDKRAHFLDVVEGTAESRADAQWGLEVMRAAEAVIVSANTGQVVPL